MIAIVVASILAMGKPQVDPSKDPLQVLAVARTPESSTVHLRIAEPSDGQTGLQNPVRVQFRIDGYALGAGSPGPRSQEIATSPKGQTIHVIVDNHPYFSINKNSIDPFNEDGNFYDSAYQFEIPYHLKSGTHVVRMFPARSYGEALKGEGTFQVFTFSIGDKAGSPEQDLQGPYLTYNEPSDHLPLKVDHPVLLDFCLTNCELTPHGYTVLLTVDGKYKRRITSWQPYYIYGLTEGKHKIELELLEFDGKRVKGPFNHVESVIELQ